MSRLGHPVWHRTALLAGILLPEQMQDKLMAQIEHEAIARGRTLLTLDTETGSGAESLYEKCGYQRVGSIPRFALSPGRELHATTVFYRELVAPK